MTVKRSSAGEKLVQVLRDMEELVLERAGLDSRKGLKIWSYTKQGYRYFCGECCPGNPRDIGPDGECECGWRTIEFRDAGI